MLDDMFITDRERIVLDLHNMEKQEAMFHLEHTIDTAEAWIKEIVVVHGYRQGQIILNMVRKEFTHKRIEKKIIAYNKGITLILLKDANKSTN